MKIFYFLFIALLAFSCSESDKKIVGNGDVQTEKYSLQDFDIVESSGAFNISFVQDTLWKVNIEAESNILPLIEVYKSGNTLFIEQEDNYNFVLNHPIEIEIHHAGITELSFSGAGSINLDEMQSATFTNSISGTCNVIGFVKGDLVDFILSGSGIIDVSVDCYDLEASLSGSGNLTFRGKSNKGTFSIAGAGDISADNLLLNFAYCNISGVGNASLNVAQELNVIISGTGNVTYKGDAVINENDITGTGSVSKID